MARIRNFRSKSLAANALAISALVANSAGDPDQPFYAPVEKLAALKTPNDLSQSLGQWEGEKVTSLARDLIPKIMKEIPNLPPSKALPYLQRIHEYDPQRKDANDLMPELNLLATAEDPGKFKEVVKGLGDCLAKEPQRPEDIALALARIAKQADAPDRPMFQRLTCEKCPFIRNADGADDFVYIVVPRCEVSLAFFDRSRFRPALVLPIVAFDIRYKIQQFTATHGIGHH